MCYAQSAKGQRRVPSMAIRIETMIITADNTVRFVQLKERRVLDIWEKKEKPEVFLAKDGRILPIKDMLVPVQENQRVRF